MSYLFKQKTKTKYDDVKSYTIGFTCKFTAGGVDTFTCEYREHVEAFLKGLFNNEGGTDRLVYIKEYR
tara:strand:- start:362 stop:565 length:204 start_codon:yes stop_codon:yes gene_type:complete